MTRILLVLLTLLVVGCNSTPKQRPINPDPLFSMNVAEVPADWPLEDRDWNLDPLIARHQVEVYHKMGPPDYFRLHWRRDNKPITQREFNTQSWLRREEKARQKTPPKASWIYLEERIWYEFDRTGARERPLSDEWRIICELGDPEEIKDVNDAVGPVTTYHYFSEGKIFNFREGKLFRTDNVQRVEGFFQRR